MNHPSRWNVLLWHKTRVSDTTGTSKAKRFHLRWQQLYPPPGDNGDIMELGFYAATYGKGGGDIVIKAPASKAFFVILLQSQLGHGQVWLGPRPPRLAKTPEAGSSDTCHVWWMVTNGNVSRAKSSGFKNMSKLRTALEETRSEPSLLRAKPSRSLFRRCLSQDPRSITEVRDMFKWMRLVVRGEGPGPRTTWRY